MKKYELTERLKKLPPYLFIEIDKIKQREIDKGVDIINLGVGDPDIPTPEEIRTVMKTAIDDPDNHQYPLGKGKMSFRSAVAAFMKDRFGVDVDPLNEIQPLIGSKEGLAHLPLAFIEPGDISLVPEPAYPVYNSSTIFAGGEPYIFSLKEENSFLPDWDKIPDDIAKKAKLLFINYPNNPTGAVATKEFFEKTVKFAKENNIIVCHDAAYTEMFFDQPPLSFLEIEGAKDVCIELHSLSKPFSMTGWRIAWACGNEEIVNGLAEIKNNIDSGVFGAVQDAGCAALENYIQLRGRAIEIYRKRADVFSAGLSELGWELDPVKATFYVWCKPPAKLLSIDSVRIILEKAGIVSTPGSGFGPSGEGFVRFALTKDVERLKQALERLGKISWTV